MILDLQGWTHGTDPEGAEFYAIADPTDPEWRMTVTSMAIYGRGYWRVDRVRVGGWWWQREGSWCIPQGATAEEGRSNAVRFLTGSRGDFRFARWLSAQLDGGISRQSNQHEEVK